MLEKIVNIDKEIFLYFNSINASWADPIMILLSSYALWTIVFILFGLLIYFFQEKNKLVSVLFYVVSVSLAALFANGLKLLVQRPRPIHEEEWSGVIHNIERHSQAFSFFSSHAATTFCIATFVFCLFKTRRAYGYIALLWAVSVSYSRIYVGKHYPGDVLVGIVFGILMGYLGYKLLNRYETRKLKP